MITEIEIEGFKSFGSPAEKIRLGGLNFLVGANASGKSNLLSALEFLKLAVMHDVEKAVNELGGISETRNRILRQNKIVKPVRFYLKIDKNPIHVQVDKKEWHIKSFDYELKLDLRNEMSIPKIESENLNVDLLHNNKKYKFVIDRKSDQVTVIDPLQPSPRKKINYKIPPQESSRLALEVGFFTLPSVILRNEISKWCFYNVTPNIARQPFRERPDIELERSGDNLSVILHKIDKSTKGKDIKNIINGLQGVIPGFKGIKVKQLDIEGKWAFQIQEERIKGFMNPSSVSDGTIRLIALLVITSWTMKKSSFVAIEEPENGIHPHLMKYLVELFREACEETKSQLLITTHCADFLDHLKPDEVILCDKIDGFTRTKKASDVEDIEIFRKHFSLGELWEQGALGGTP